MRFLILDSDNRVVGYKDGAFGYSEPMANEVDISSSAEPFEYFVYKVYDKNTNTFAADEKTEQCLRLVAEAAAQTAAQQASEPSGSPAAPAPTAG